MKQLLLLLIVLTACTSVTEEFEPVNPAPSQPTTTNMPSTTTTQPTPTTVEDECVERDGVLRATARGLICPPHLTSGIGAEPAVHVPGTYITRLFQPALEFTHEDRFRSYGEMPALVVIDHQGGTPLLPSRGVGAISGPAADTLFGVPDLTPIQHGDDWDWAIEETAIRTTEIGGHPARTTGFLTRCWDGVSDPSHISNFQCSFSLPDSGLPGESWTYLDRQQVTLFLVDIPGHTVLLEVRANEDTFDAYWTEVAQPILDSIEFLDQ